MDNSSINSSTPSKEADKKNSKKVGTNNKRTNQLKKSKKYDHVKSKVGQYIQQIKRQEAENKRKKQLEIEMRNCSKNEKKKIFFLPLNIDKSSTNSSDIVDINNELEKVNDKDSESTIKCLLSEWKKMQLQFEKEQQKINQLEIQMAEVQNCIKLIFHNENLKNNLIQNDISNRTINNNQKMIDKLNLEPCECWNEPLIQKSPRNGTIQTIINTPTITTSDESPESPTLIQDSTKMSITTNTSKFYSTDTTSYKRLIINFENLRGKQLKDKILSEFNENHKTNGEKAREALTKALCLSARSAIKNGKSVWPENYFVAYSNNQKEEWTLNQAILYIEDIKNRVSSLKLLLQKYSSLT